MWGVPVGSVCGPMFVCMRFIVGPTKEIRPRISDLGSWSSRVKIRRNLPLRKNDLLGVAGVRISQDAHLKVSVPSWRKNKAFRRNSSFWREILTRHLDNSHVNYISEQGQHCTFWIILNYTQQYFQSFILSNDWRKNCPRDEKRKNWSVTGGSKPQNSHFEPLSSTSMLSWKLVISYTRMVAFHSFLFIRASFNCSNEKKRKGYGKKRILFVQELW